MLGLSSKYQIMQRLRKNRLYAAIYIYPYCLAQSFLFLLINLTSYDYLLVANANFCLCSQVGPIFCLSSFPRKRWGGGDKHWLHRLKYKGIYNVSRFQLVEFLLHETIGQDYGCKELLLLTQGLAKLDASICTTYILN